MNIIDDSEDYNTRFLGFSDICHYCKNYKYDRSCKAYLELISIPTEIWTGKHDHKTPYPGDNGILFEPIEEKN